MRITFTLVLSLMAMSLFAQYQIRPAIIKKSEGNTLAGFIQFYDWDANPEFISFSEDSLGTYNSIPVNSIRRLDIGSGAAFEVLRLSIPYYVSRAVDPGESIIQRTDTSSSLAELLLESDVVKLYRIFDADKKIRYVLSKRDSAAVLDDINVKLNKRGTVYTFESPAYRKTLSALLSECTTLAIDKTVYTDESLLNLVKEYVSFCRIDAKVYHEQRKIAKPIVGLGAFVSSWQTDPGLVTGYGITAQFLLAKRFHNVFVILDVGRFGRNTSTGSEVALQLGIYAGRYFGRGAVQGKLFTGLSTLLGPLDTGAGISYRKMIALEIRYPMLSSVTNGLLENDIISRRPLFGLRAVFNL